MNAVEMVTTIPSYSAKVIQFPIHDCEVCGNRKLILKRWNDHQVCLECIEDLNSEDYVLR